MRRAHLVSILAAVALTAAFPAMTSASVWKHGNSNVSQLVEIGLDGAESFGVQGIAGAITCEVSATLRTSGGSTGTFTKYSLFACSGSGGLANCVPLATESKGLPWTVDVNAADLTLTKMRIRRTFSGKGCPISETDLTWNPTLVLDTPASIFEMEFFFESALYVSAGLLQVTSPNAGTYGIG
jgi:hypothetical protein